MYRLHPPGVGRWVGVLLEDTTCTILILIPTIYKDHLLKTSTLLPCIGISKISTPRLRILIYHHRLFLCKGGSFQRLHK
jgi:hypothetical protein